MWASRGVQVVRPGTRVEHDGPVLYLLVSDRQLVVFEIGHVIKLLHWLNPRCLRLRIGRRSGSYQTEWIVSTAEGEFLRAERRYGPRTDAHAQVWVTGDASLASRWSSHIDGSAAHASFRAARSSLECAPARTEGAAYDAGEPSQRDAWLRAALRTWDKPDAVFRGVYEYAPGVWAHETSEIDPGARVVGQSNARSVAL